MHAFTDDIVLLGELEEEINRKLEMWGLGTSFGLPKHTTFCLVDVKWSICNACLGSRSANTSLEIKVGNHTIP